MKIKQLYIKNIASIEEAFIDFDAEPLKDSDLFLISGKIGAGKSTILDAICLALFGTTPRINIGIRERVDANDDNLSGRDPRQLMRQNTGEASVRLCFDGTNGNSYEAEWQVQRGLRKKASSALSADVWTLHNLNTDELLVGSTSKDKGIREAVQKAVCLDFDQFCRTTMLAQGDFTKFLKSDEKEKAAILEKITGTGIYSKIGAKIFELTKEHREALKVETNKLNGIQLLSQEEIDAQWTRIKEIEEGNARLVKEWEQAVESRRDMKEVKECQDELVRLEQEMETRLKQQYVLGLKGKKALEDSLQQLNEKRKAVSEKIESQQRKAEVYGKCQTILQLLRTVYKAKQQIEDKTKEKPRLEKELAEQQRLLETKRVDYKAFQRSYVTMESALKIDEEQLKAMNLPGVRTQKDHLNIVINELQNLLTRLDALTNQGKKLKELEKQNKELWIEIEQLERSLPLHQEKLQAGKELLASLETLKNLSAQTVDQWAKQIRSTLKEGCVCPVCQQTLQQALPVESALDQAYQDHMKQYDAQKATVDELTNQWNKLSANIEAKRRQHALNETNLAKSYAELQQEARRFLEEASRHGIQTMPEASETIKALKQGKEDEAFQLGIRIEEVEHFEVQVNGKKDQLNKQAKACAKAMDDMNQVEKAVSDSNNAIKNLETALSDLEKSISESGNEVDALLGKDDVDVMDWRTDMIGFANKLKMEAQQFMDDQAYVKELNNQLKEKQSTLQVVDDICLKIIDLLPVWKSLRPEGSQDVERIVNYWNELHVQLSAKLQMQKTALQKKENAEQRLAALQVTDTAESLDDRIAGLERQINALKEERASITKALELDALYRKDKEDLQLRITALTETYSQWKRLCDHFGNADGSLFQKIAQSFILGNLLGSANNYLKSLHPRYSLEVIPGTLHISLVDAYQGYATRLVSTLSGGESFLVSLALALALADIGQNLAVDTLFIDEGFGSLSGQELHNAINTLRALHRANGRRVGIISHVEAVKESVPVQIQVVQEGNRSSSVVKVSDN